LEDLRVLSPRARGLDGGEICVVLRQRAMLGHGVSARRPREGSVACGIAVTSTTENRTNVNYGYLIGAALMIAAGLVAVFLAVAAERKTLEDVGRPLTAVRRRVAAAMPAAAR
jgi:hypothetical protein